MPKLLKPFKIVLPGDVYPTELAAGAAVDGEIAEKAKAAGCIAKQAPSKKAMKAPENK